MSSDLPVPAFGRRALHQAGAHQDGVPAEFFPDVQHRLLPGLLPPEPAFFFLPALLFLLIPQRAQAAEEAAVDAEQLQKDLEAATAKAEEYLMRCLVEEGGQLEAPTDYLILR